MDDYPRDPVRRHPSPSAQRRNDEHWRTRVGLVVLAILVLGSGTLLLELLRTVRGG
jgi:hypothetical protein